MSTPDDPSVDDLDLRAAEYVLGTLDYRERAAFADLLRVDPTAQRAVGRWERRLADLAGGFGAVAPPPELWHRIERSIGTGAVRPFRVVEGGAANRAAALREALERSRNRWRVSALASGLVAASLAIVVFGGGWIGGRGQPETDDVYVAAINRGGDKPAMIVRVDLRSGTVMVRPVAAETPAGRSLELWYIDAGKAPRAVGLVGDAPSTLRVPSDAGGAATIAVSVEPPGGSTTGGPTGPVVYSGQLIKE